MKNPLLLPVILLLLIGVHSYGQDFSNKGKDFWVGYSTHVSMYSGSNVNPLGGSQNLILYFTSDQTANVTITIPSTGWTRTYIVAANTVTESDAIPKTGLDDVRLATEGKSKKGIHITSDVPIVAYAHNYDGSVSGATLLFPTNTLGKDYYTLGFTQTSNSNYSYPFCFVIATEDNTVVEITPSANTQTRLAGVTYYDTLQKGEILNLLGQLTGTVGGNFTGVDITGTRIRSVSGSAGGCKKIAVFCGTGKLNIRCSATGGNSADNTIQQAFPSSAWGRKYVTVPTKNMDNNFFRVMVNDPATVVKLNGSVLSGLINGRYYQFQSNAANIVEADQPVIVSQYITTANACGNTILGGTGDPEMIYLSPVEQTINRITLNSTIHAKITQHYINVAIRTTAIGSFSLDGVNKSADFIPVSADNGFSYAQFLVSVGIHTLNCDSGYNAIAYGYGLAESYGYNAGTSIKDFTQVASFQNPFQRIDSAVTCVNTPLQFGVPLNFKPTTIQWDFSKAPNMVPNTNIGPISSPQSDSTRPVNGQILYYYSTRQSYQFTNTNNAALRDTIKMYTTSATPDGCGSTSQVYAIPVKVNSLPVAGFTINNTGCVTDSVYVTDQSTSSNGPVARWLWNFGDGSTADLSSSIVSPKLYVVAVGYDLKLRVINNIGCASDSIIHRVTMSSKPIAKITFPSLSCVNSNITFTDSSTIQSGTIAKWTWDLGNGAGPVASTTNAAQSATYPSFGAKNITLKVESSTGCQSAVYTPVTPFKVYAYPDPGFVLPEICLNDASAIFTDTTKVADGSPASGFSYAWSFNAGTPAVTPGPNTLTSTAQNPQVHYNNYGNYKVSTAVTSNGCVSNITKDFTVNGSNPVSAFSVSNAGGLCSNRQVEIINQSTVDFGGLSRLEIYWDANDLTKKTVDENPFFNKKYSHLYDNFQAPATKNYTITLIAYSGATSSSCKNSVSKVVTINASPSVKLSTLPGICYDSDSRLITQSSYNASVTNATGSPVFIGKGITNGAAGLFDPKVAGVGTFPIEYLAVSDKGCRDSIIKNITEWPSSVANWSVSNIRCEKNAVIFTDNSAANFSNIVQRKWDYGDGTTEIKSADTSFTHIYATAKTYNASLQVLTDSGCRSNINQQAVTVHYLPKVSFNLPGICLPDGRGQFKDTSFVADGSQALFSYLWNFNDPNDPSASTLKNPVHRYTVLGPYNVKLRITTKDGCIDSLTQSLTTVYPQPKADFTVTPAEVCMGDTVRFKDTGNGMTSPSVSWVWDLADGNSSVLQNPLRKFRDSGVFTVRYYFFNGQGCVSDTTAKQVVVDPYPKLVIGPNLVVLEGGTITIKPKFVYGNQLQYQWLPATYLNSDTAANPKTSPQGDITYKLILTGKGSCAVSDTIFIKLLLSVEVPNVFSPNGDGINDTWHIKYLDSYPGATIQVYNRYGQVVFSSVGYDTDWNGTYKDQLLPVGTYYYIINPKNGKPILTGSVSLIK